MRKTMLFLPGNTPKMILNGAYLKADSVILDLEDAAAPEEKDSARVLVRSALDHFDFGKHEVIVRINGLDTEYWEKDLEAVVPGKPDVIMPTKVSGADYVHTLDKRITELEIKSGIEPGHIKLIPLMETCAGIENAFEIATASKRMIALYLGAEDLTADMRCPRTKEGKEIDYARSRLVVAARTAGIEVYDTPYTDLEDLAGLEKDARYARSLGFTGKAVISPRHIDIVNKVFRPTQAEIDHARDVVEAIEEGRRQGKSAVTLHGKMVDPPMLLRANQVLKAAEDM